MTTNGYSNSNHNGHGLHTNDDFTGLPSEMEDPVTIKGFSVTYDRTFHLGDFKSLNPAITIHLRREAPGDEAFDLHNARERVRRMARENVRAQLLRQLDKPEVVFLGLQPPPPGAADPVCVHTVCVSLVYQSNLAKGQPFMLGYTDWADLRDVAHSPGELHMALARLWQSLWANVADELSRARGNGGTSACFGLPVISAEVLAAVPYANGCHPKHKQAGSAGEGLIQTGKGGAV